MQQLLVAIAIARRQNQKLERKKKLRPLSKIRDVLILCEFKAITHCSAQKGNHSTL